MIKVKDGYAKLIGTTYSGSADRVLLSNGGDKAVSDFAAASALGNYVTLATTQTITGEKTFTSNIYINNGKAIFDQDGNGVLGIKPTNWTGVPSNTISLGTLNTSLYFRSSGDDIYHYRNDKGASYKVLDSSNYSSYALPLSGGTITGTLGKSNNYIFKPNGGDYRTGGTNTGAICISLPKNIGSPMISMWIDVYNYRTNTSFSVHVGGYMPSNGNPLRSFAMVYGASHKVRLAYEDCNKIYIGETNTSWNAPQISIRDVVMGYIPNYSNLCNDWNISFVTSLPTTTVELSRYAITTDNISNQSVNYATSAGNSSLASKWATPRTITLTGSVTGSVSIDGSQNVSLSTTTNHTHSYSSLTDIPTRLSKYITSTLEDGNGFGRLASNSPFLTFVNSSNPDCMLITTAYSDAWRGELALDYRSNNIAYRNKNNGTWNSWAMMLSNANSSVSGGGSTGGSSITVTLANTSKTLTIPTSLPASDVYDWAKQSTKPSYKTSEVVEETNLYFTNQRAINACSETYLSLLGGDLKGATDYSNLPDSNKLFGTNKGLIHIRKSNPTGYYGNAITWSHANHDTAQAGIYVTSGASYGTEMWLGTTNVFANGVYAALKIDNVGRIHAVRNNFVGNLTGNCSGSSGFCTGNAATATIASTVNCTQATSANTRPIVGTDTSNSLYYSTLATVKWNTGEIGCGGINFNNDTVGGNSLIKIPSYNVATKIFRVYSSDATYAEKGVYGFDLTYTGNESGNNNKLVLRSDNQQASTQVDAITVYQDGNITFANTPKVGTNIIYHSDNLTKSVIENLLTGNITSHTHNQYFFSEQVSNTQNTLSWIQTYADTNHRSYVYNTSGLEYSYLIGMNTNNTYGTILKLGYNDRYLRILRKRYGNWQSTDWEKISAGYADTSGNADTLNGIQASGLFTDLSNSNNNISITIGGTNKTLTVGYATSAGDANTLEGNSASSFATASALSSKISKSGDTMTGELNTCATRGTWISGMTSAAIRYNNLAPIDSASFWKFFNMKSVAGHVVCYGGLGNNIGFYGYYAGHTANNTDWSFAADTTNGNWTASASIYATSFYESSDERLKDFIRDVEVDLSKIRELPKKYFVWKKDTSTFHIGTSAQAVQKLYPELVSSNTDGYLTVDYAKLSIIALKAIDLIYDTITDLKHENALLKERVSKLEKLLVK